MITEIYLVPHSHTDIGYTHPQPVVLELHRRFLDTALDLVESTAHLSDGSAHRWVVEVSGTAIDWWRHAATADRDRLVAATRAGLVEVAGIQWNQAHLSDHHMLIEAMRPVEELRAAGIPIRSAMNTDVNGANWGLVDVLDAFGFEHFTMAINEHFGHAVRPRPQAFRWQSPSGRELLVYNGLMYGVTVSGWLGIPHDMDRTVEAVPRLVELLEQRGYPHSVLIMQATNVNFHDNAGPMLTLPSHVRRFNEKQGRIRLHIATMGQAMDRLRRDDLGSIPVQRGDWPDWWSFGAGSTARETAIALAGQRAMRDGQQILGWHFGRTRRSDTLERRAADALALFVEHTYTADRAARKHDSQESDSQIHWKKAQAYEGYALARMLRRDGLAALAATSGKGNQAALLAYNPLPFPIRRPILVPRHDIDVHKQEGAAVLRDGSAHVVQRQDVEFGDISAEDQIVTLLDLPALGYAVMPHAALAPPAGDLMGSAAELANEFIRLKLDAVAGGVRSMLVDGEERLTPDWDFLPGVPVLERPVLNRRTALYGPVIFNRLEHSIDLHQDWHQDWTARYEAGRLVGTDVHRRTGFIDVEQRFAFSTGEAVAVTWRLGVASKEVAVETIVDKGRIATPHAFYLPLPLALGSDWTTHYETAGAVVELDREQLSGACRHFVVTQRFIRMQDGQRGVTVGSPDTPLFQVGGFTFGRHHRGEVVRHEPVLLAWLNNNYWDTNFEVTQSGPIRTRLYLEAHVAEPISSSVARALRHVCPPQFHMMTASGESRHQMLAIEANGLLLTGSVRHGVELRLYFLNPDDRPHLLHLESAALQIAAARQISLSGRPGQECLDAGGGVNLSVAARAWIGVELTIA
jgi:hypothetical protein